MNALRWLCFCAGLLTAILSISGCSKGFYVSESEVAAYQSELRTENDSNRLFSSLPIADLHVTFDSSGNVPHIRSTNILEILRNLPAIRLLEAHTYVHLDRLSSQIEKDADAWIADKLYFLQQDAGSGVKLTSLDQTNVHFMSSPVFSYDPSQNAISVSSSVRLSFSGRLHVDVVGGLTGVWASATGQNPNGDYDLTIQIDNFHVQSRFQFFNVFRDGARVLVHVTPQPGTVTVRGNAPDNIKNGIRDVISSRLSSPIDAQKVLLYDNFSLPQVTVAKRNRFSPAELRAGYLPRPHRADPQVDLVFRGADGKYYHARKSGGSWSDFSAVPLPGRMVSDPALAVSGAGQLELVGITTQGELVHTAWRDGAWTNVSSPWRRPGGFPLTTFRSQKPAIVTTAPGQVDLWAIGSDGQLYYARHINGQWGTLTLQWVQGAAQLPLRDPVVALSGNKIAIFFADGRNRLFGAVYQSSTQSWGAAQEIPTAGVQFAPAAASCGDGRIDLVYVKADQTLGHRVAGFESPALGIFYTNETSLGGRWTSAPALTCSGYQQLELLARDTNQKLQHNHFVAATGPHGPVEGRLAVPGWQGWTPTIDRFFGTLGFTGAIDSSFAVGSTRSGDVELVARAPGLITRKFYETTYDASRFATSSWKTVHWGGWRPTVSPVTLHGPALAITDRELEIGSNWGATDIWRSALGDDNVSDFKDLPDSLVTVGIDPVVVSSGPGSIEYFHLRDGGIEDIRLMNGVRVPTLLPDSRDIDSPLAVQAYGNGQIEVVAVATDRTIHHWRRLDGVWQDPITLPGTVPVISAPILVHVGDGQLEFMAVGGDQRLYYSRFGGEGWTNSYQMPSDFNLSAVLFGQSAASSWGDGTVDLVVVEDGTGKMFHARAMRSVTNIVFKEIGGQTIEVPVLTALGPERLKLLALGTDGYLYENNARPPQVIRRAWRPIDVQRGLHLEWPGFRPLTATRVLPGTVARLGTNELFILVTDTSGKLYYNRFFNGWKGFASLPLQPSQVEHSPLYKPMAAVH